MKFSHEYRKLQDRLFTTIREGDYYREGQIIECHTPMGAIKAKVLLKVQRRFNNIPEALLQYDTDNPELSAKEIIEEIQALYYRNPPGLYTDMTIYLLERQPEARS